MILALSFFDQVIGPTIFFSSDNQNMEKYSAQILRLMDISNEEGFFEFNLADQQLNSLNYRFTIYSETGRAHVEYLMISLITSTYNQTFVFRPFIEKFLKKLKEDRMIFKGLYYDPKKKDSECFENYTKLQNLFNECAQLCNTCLKEGLLGHIAFIGIYRVGKTSLLNRITTGQFDSNVRPTLGVQIIKFMIENYSLYAYDVGGQSKLKSLWDQIRVPPKALVYVIDCSLTQEQKKEARHHFDEVITHFILDHKNDKLYCPPVLLLANKKDLNTTFTKDDINTILEPARYEFTTRLDVVSALTGEGINEAFRWLMQQLLFCE